MIRENSTVASVQGDKSGAATLSRSDALIRSLPSGLAFFILVFGLLGGCAILPPGSEFPKTASTALASPEQTQLGRQFESSARAHGGTSGFRLSARLQVYREILEVSRRHAPDASFSQYYAYWHHRCHERADGWPRLLRWLPSCHWWLAYAHRRLPRLVAERAFF